MTRCVVVGAGSVGILAAYLCKSKYDEVILIEKNSELGGLLSSFEMNGAKYDYGTHIPGMTGNKTIDEFLFGNEDEIERDFYKFPYLKSENYFKGTWNKKNTLLDVRKLKHENYLAGMLELLEAPGLDGSEENLAEFLEKSVGKTFSEEAYKPVIEKLQGKEVELQDLLPEVLRTFGLQRVIALTSKVSKELKQIARLDQSLAYHSYDDHEREGFYYYPKGNNGIGKWMEYAIDKLEKCGVKILQGEEVSSIEHENGTIGSIILKNNDSIPIDHLVWTVPAFLAYKAAKIEFISKPPKFRNHILCHYEFDIPFMKKAPQYLLCWEPGFYSYRITLYPNITSDTEKSSRFNLTVEVLTGKLESDIIDNLMDTVQNELIELEIIKPESKRIASKLQNLGAGFPVFTTDFMKNVIEQAETLNSNLNNFSLLGRASGRGFFINDLLRDTYTQLIIENENG